MLGIFPMQRKGMSGLHVKGIELLVGLRDTLQRGDSRKVFGKN
jgi:hypothetical protein